MMLIATWFSGLSRNGKLITLLATFIVGTLIYYGVKVSYLEYQILKKEAEKVKVLESEKEEMMCVHDSLEKVIDKLDKERVKQVYKYYNLKKKLDSNKDEKSNVISSVRLLTDEQLDSTIRTYKHPEGG